MLEAKVLVHSLSLLVVIDGSRHKNRNHRPQRLSLPVKVVRRDRLEFLHICVNDELLYKNIKKLLHFILKTLQKQNTVRDLDLILSP